VCEEKERGLRKSAKKGTWNWKKEIMERTKSPLELNPNSVVGKKGVGTKEGFGPDMKAPKKDFDVQKETWGNSQISFKSTEKH